MSDQRARPVVPVVSLAAPVPAQRPAPAEVSVSGAPGDFAGLLDEHGRVLHVNAVGLASGASTSDVVGRPLAETPWWAGRDGVRARIDALVVDALRGATVVDDVVLLDADGRDRPVELRLEPVPGDGRTRFVVVSGRVTAPQPA